MWGGRLWSCGALDTELVTLVVGEFGAVLRGVWALKLAKVLRIISPRLPERNLTILLAVKRRGGSAWLTRANAVILLFLFRLRLEHLRAVLLGYDVADLMEVEAAELVRRTLPL